MTEQQIEYLRLFNGGYTVTEIAEMKGKNKSTVSRVLTRARSKRCPFSSDCFACPLDDCAIKTKYVDAVNGLLIGRNDHRSDM
ncbi:MAG: hypothetical protein IIV05_01635 [Ruminococcus sp.]|nr:hypothetical protein [Ruminococcus sp.]